MVIFSLLTSRLPFLLWTSALNMQNAAPGNDYRCDPWCVHAQLCLTLWDPMDYNPPGSSIHGISQARMLEWAAISFSRWSSWPTFLAAPALVSGFLTTCATWEALTLVKYIELKLILHTPVHSPSVSVSPEQAFPPQFTRTSTLSMSLPIQLLTHTHTHTHTHTYTHTHTHTHTHSASLSESIHLNFGYSSPTSKQSPHSLILPSSKMENSRGNLTFHAVYSKGPCFKKKEQEGYLPPSSG